MDLTKPKYMKSSLNKQYVSYIANIMPTEAMATLGARAPAGIVLTLKAEIIRLQHHKSYYNTTVWIFVTKL